MTDCEACIKKDEIISEMFMALEKVREDINWMLNNSKLLRHETFDYLDKIIAKAEGKK